MKVHQHLLAALDKLRQVTQAEPQPSPSAEATALRIHLEMALDIVTECVGIAVHISGPAPVKKKLLERL